MRSRFPCICRRTSRRRCAGRAATTSPSSSQRVTISGSSTPGSTSSPRFLFAGDLLPSNVSATLAAALDVRLDGQALQLWLSTPTPDGSWLVELRTSDRRPYPRPPLGGRLDLPDGVQAQLIARFAGSDRLSVARFELDEPLEDYLRRYGQPVRYAYVPEIWPLAAYQTVFAREPGSAEMPSAGRPSLPTS